MEVRRTYIDGLAVIEPKVFRDRRGYFLEAFSQHAFAKSVAAAVFVQDNESQSSYGVIRGLHYQKGADAQGKLVRVSQGSVLDVAVDLRRHSPTFGRHFGIILSEENHLQLFIPKGFAHGFATLSEKAVLQYKCDAPYAPLSEASVAWNDPDIGIDWMLPAEDVILSEKDMKAPPLRDAEVFE